MQISKNSVVTITYQLHKEDADGEVVEVVSEEAPFAFLFGIQPLLPAFENNLEGLKKDDSFAFEVLSEEAYGTYDEEAIAEVPKSIFDVEVEGKNVAEHLQTGVYVPLQDQEGNVMQGLVMEIKDNSIVIDFNHPMAGKDLFFEGKVLEVREATAEEIEHGHAHGEHGHQH
jgi:FKBP-type peptidyl-prolyl cis-trans isomerase SlyD